MPFDLLADMERLLALPGLRRDQDVKFLVGYFTGTSIHDHSDHTGVLAEDIRDRLHGLHQAPELEVVPIPLGDREEHAEPVQRNDQLLLKWVQEAGVFNFLGCLGRRVEFKDAVAKRQAVWEYAPGSMGAKEALALCEALDRRAK